MGRLLALLVGACLPIAAMVGLAQDGPPVARSRPGSTPLVAEELLVPNSSALVAAADIETVPAYLRPYIRYVSLYNLPLAERKPFIQTLNFCVNSVSRARLIKPCYVVPGSDYSVVRLCLLDYQFYDEEKKQTFGWNPKVYEKLADIEPYFHANLVKTVTKIVEKQAPVRKYVNTGRYYPNGQPEQHVQVTYEAVSEAIQKDIKVRSAATWTNAAAMAKLIQYTGSQVPLVRGDWFIVQITLPPFYHDFLDLGDTEDDFLAMLFENEKDLARARLDIKGVVVKSGAGVDGVIPVSRGNRTIIRQQTRLGYLWRTRDTEKNVNDRDYLRILINENFDATELIATGRNGLQFYFLATGNAAAKPRQRQDEAPIAIVVDNTNLDRRVRNGRSCITCHTDGLRPFRPLPQELVTHLIDVVSPDERKAYELRELYVTNVSEFVAADTMVYARAVRQATRTEWSEGLTIEQNAVQYGRFYNRYAEDYITPQIAAQECGVPVKDLLPILACAQNDPHLIGLSKNEPLFTIRREHWEQSFQQAMVLVLKANERKTP